MTQDAKNDLEEIRQHCGKLESSLACFKKLAFEICQIHEDRSWELSAGIHDQLLQVLNIAHLTVERCLAKEEHQGKLLVEQQMLTELGGLISRSIEEAQAVMHDLSSPVLKYLGLAPALHWLAERVSSGKKIKINVKEEGSCGNLPEHIKRLVFSAAREIMSFAEQSADIDEFKVCLRTSSSDLELELFCPHSCDLLARIDSIWENLDLGCESHMRASSKDPRALYLACIREQCRFLGGDLKTHGKDDSGINLVLSLPLR